MGNMSKHPREQVKTILFLLFVFFNIVLIFFIWSDNLSERISDNHGFFRGSQILNVEPTDIPVNKIPDQNLEPENPFTPAPPTIKLPGHEDYDQEDVSQYIPPPFYQWRN
jgi:hypothetical protein